MLTTLFSLPLCTILRLPWHHFSSIKNGTLLVYADSQKPENYRESGGIELIHKPKSFQQMGHDR